MIRLFLTASLFFISACTGNDKKTSNDDTVIVADIEGEALFKANCASCHKPDRDFVAPPLKGALQRWGGDKKKMYAFIRNPSESIDKNPYARELFRKWKTSMTAFPALTDSEIDVIMNYAENYSAHPIP